MCNDFSFKHGSKHQVTIIDWTSGFAGWALCHVIHVYESVRPALGALNCEFRTGDPAGQAAGVRGAGRERTPSRDTSSPEPHQDLAPGSPPLWCSWTACPSISAAYPKTKTVVQAYPRKVQIGQMISDDNVHR